MRYLISGILLAACGCMPPRADYQTRCGTWTDGDLAPLQAAEDRLLVAFAPQLGDVCPLLRNWYLRINPASDGGAWYSERNGFDVAGLTWCEVSTIDVANWDFQWNAYAHEVLHALDCGHRPPNSTHEGWDEWQWSAIGAAQGHEQVTQKGIP